MLPVLFLAMAALPGTLCALTGVWSPPWFCHNNECPKFTLTENHTDYEKRHYEPSVWVSTSFDNIRFDRSVNSGMFFKLFHYIDSGNTIGTKIAMTSPVLVEHVLLPGGKSNVTMSFMVPFKLQANPPLPTDATVSITKKPAMDIYVIEYPGFDSSSLRDKELHLLKQDLVTDGATTNYDTGRYATAGYDSPFTFSHRHNEIWLMALS